MRFTGAVLILSAIKARITRIENLVGRLPNILNETEGTLAKTGAEFEEAKTAVVKPFEYEERLNEFVARQSEINTKLEFAELSKQEETIPDDKGSDASESEKFVNTRESETETEEKYDKDNGYAVHGVEV